MAEGITLVILFVSTAVLLICDIGLCSPSYVEINPESVRKFNPKDITITCFTSNHAIAMDLGKKDEEPLVSLQGTSLQYSSRIKANMKVTTSLASRKSPGNYFSLIITNPTVQDFGTYKCDVHYNDTFARSGKDEVYARMNVDNNELNSIFSLAIEKTTSLEALLRQITFYTNLQGLHINDFKDEITTFARQLANQKDEINVWKTRKMDEKLFSQQIKDHIDDKIKQLGTIEEAAPKDNMVKHTSAFLVTVLGDYYYNLYEYVKFPNVKLNLGGNYNSETGIYRAPIHGLYTFHLVITSCKGDLFTPVIRVNSDDVLATITYDHFRHTQSTLSVVRRLYPGDRVRVFVHYLRAKRDRMLVERFPFTSFSGYLIYPIDNIS